MSPAAVDLGDDVRAALIVRIGAEQRLVKSVADVSPEDVAGEVG